MSPSEPEDQTEESKLQPATLCGLLVALLGLPLLAFVDRSLDLSPLAEIVLRWTPLVIVVGVTVLWEDRSVRSLGFRRPQFVDIGYFLLVAVLLFLALAATSPLLDALGLSEAAGGGYSVGETSVGLALATAVSAGIIEELLYRGYVIERLLEYSESAVFAGGISWGVFTLAHGLSWQLGDLVQVSLGALVFTVVYLRRRSVVPLIGAHVLVLVVGVLGAIYG